MMLFIQHEQVTCSVGSNLLRIYLFGVVAILLTVIGVTAVLVCFSAKGSVMDDAPRAHVSTILMIRVILAMPELFWNGAGSVLIFAGMIDCNDHAPLWMLLKSLLVVTWVALAFLVFTIVLLFEPMQRPHGQEKALLRRAESSYTIDATMGSHYIQLWERRCRILCCANSKDETSLEALRNVADVLASIFEDNELVASDIAAALVLLRLKQKYEDKREKLKAAQRSLKFHEETDASIAQLQNLNRNDQLMITNGDDVVSEASPNSLDVSVARQEFKKQRLGADPSDSSTVVQINHTAPDVNTIDAGLDPNTGTVNNFKTPVAKVDEQSISDLVTKAKSSPNIPRNSAMPSNTSGTTPKSSDVATDNSGDGVENVSRSPGDHKVVFSDRRPRPSCSPRAPLAEGVPPPPHQWMTVENSCHFMKFALGSYGWPWFVYGKCCSSMGAMWPFIKCCTPCCCR